MAAYRKESLSLGVSIPLSDLLSLGQSPREGEKSYEPNQIERRLYDKRKNNVAQKLYESDIIFAGFLAVLFQQDDLEMQELAKQWAREFLKQRLP